MEFNIKQLPDVIHLLKEGAIEQGLPEVNVVKISNWLKENVDNPKVYIGVNKDVSAILILMKTPDLFSYKDMIRDLVFYSTSTGAGFRLLKEGQKWVNKWGKSVYEAYLTTSQSTEEVDDMLERFGMIKMGSQFKFNRAGEL